MMKMMGFGGSSPGGHFGALEGLPSSRQIVLTLDQTGFNYGTTSGSLINLATFAVNWAALPNVELGLVIQSQTLLCGSGNAGIVQISVNTGPTAVKWRHTFPSDNLQHGPLYNGTAQDPMSTFGIPEPVEPGLIGALLSDQYTLPFMNPGGAGAIHLGAMGGGNTGPTAFQQSGFNNLLLQIVIF
jgi:hypothetical protein